MATVMFPLSAAQTATVSSSFSAATQKRMSATRGASATTQTDNTVASLSTTLTNGNNVVVLGAATALAYATGVETLVSGNLVFITDPLYAVTISGTITPSLWANESAAQANYGTWVGVYRIQPDGTITKIGANLVSASELGTTAAAVSGNTITPTSTALNDGDRLAVLIGGLSEGGTSTASGRTYSVAYNGPTNAASGDSKVTFTETIVEGYLPPQRRWVVGGDNKAWRPNPKVWMPASGGQP